MKNKYNSNKGIICFGLLLFGVLMFMTLVSASFENLETMIPATLNEEYTITQTCNDATWINISIINKNGYVVTNAEMINNGSSWYYKFTPTVQSLHDINVLSDGCEKSGVARFEVSSSGEILGINQSIVIIAQLGIVALFFGLGRAFAKGKWKIALFFDILSVLMSVVLLNSIKIIATQSENLGKMGEAGFTIGLIVLIFLFLYLFIYSLIEVFKYFKKQKRDKWSISEDPY